MASPKVSFFSQEVRVPLTQRTQLKAFIEGLFRREKKRLASLTYIFCTDEALLAINRDFLKHDYYTDIITFDLSEPGQPITAEIYISVDRVRENAQTWNTTIKGELHRVIFHGALHLCGFKDSLKADQLRMRQKEEEYLERYLGTP